MFMKLLGVFDLVSAFILLGVEVAPKTALLVAAVYLIVKGLIFALSGDFISYLDVAIGLYMIIAAFGLWFSVLNFASAVFLFQKGLVSFS